MAIFWLVQQLMVCDCGEFNHCIIVILAIACIKCILLVLVCTMAYVNSYVKVHNTVFGDAHAHNFGG